MNAVTMEKGNGEYKWVNNGQKFELMTKDTFIVTKQSPFHWMNTMVTGGREWTKMEHTRNIFVDKVNKAQMINKMKIEEHNILDGQTWYHIKYDNTAPKTAFLLLQEGQPHHAPSLWQGPHHRPGLAQDDPRCLWSEEGLPGCCRQQPLDGRLQAFQAGRV